jgi:predicted MPP superfamily phosphohydrolase
VNVNRRQFIGALGALGVASIGSDAVFVEPNEVVVTRHALNARASAQDAALRIVQLTDLHLQRLGAHEHHIAETVNALAPDLVLITGDSIDRRDHLPELGAFLDLLRPSVPKYAILGNWEYQAHVDIARLADVYAARNCRLLVNETVVHRQSGGELLITGVDDLVAGSPRFGRALRGVEPRPHHIVLAHCPAYRDRLTQSPALRSPAEREELEGAELSRYAPQYVFSGHTHGGQVNILGWAPWLPEGCGRYLSGWYRDARPALYVSRGLGTSTLPIRFGAPPEIAQFELFLSRG